MKKLFFAFVLASVSCAWAELYFVGKTNKDALSYRCSEEMIFDIQLFDDDKLAEGYNLEWTITNDDGAPMRSGKAVSAKEPLRLATKVDKPGFARVRVSALDKEGKKIFVKVGNRNIPVAFNGGAGADVREITNSTQEPADFDAFWARQLQALAKVPAKCEMKLSEKLSNNDFSIYELTVDCVGKPAKAWLSIPKNATDKSLPIDVSLHGYGVSRELPHTPKNAIGLRVARHTYELLREPKYYKDLKNGELRAFGLQANINENPENCYFKFMVLRDVRTLDWVKKNVSQWNGKDIVVRGGSMGGFRSIFLSYLDKDITACYPNVPWMTDLWASDNDPSRIKCNFKPEWTPSIRYFDSTFAVKRVKCPVYITAWLGDYTCPPAGIMVLFNNANSFSSIDFGQNGTHAGQKIRPETCVHSKLSK